MPDDGSETASTSQIQPAPPELQRSPLDFSSTIDRLDKRAIAARKRARWAGALLVLGAYGAASVLVLSQSQEQFRNFGQLSYFGSSDNRQSAEAPFARRVGYLMNRLIGPSTLKEDEKFILPTRHEAAQLHTDIKEALIDFEKAVQIADTGKKVDVQASQIAPLVSTAIFSLGAIGILIFLIQISVIFIRYHLRLAELYDAQADALRASGGDASLA